MSRSLMLAAALACALAAAPGRARAGAAPQETWIASGQSNACGRAALPGPAAVPAVTAWDAAARKWVPAADPLPGMGSQGVGPWVSAAQGVAKHGLRVRLAGFASGGQPISYWDAGGTASRYLDAAIAAAGERPGVFLWYQGETDAAAGMDCETYRKKLADLVARVRKQAANPKMTVVVVQLGGWKEKRGDFMPVREAQRLYCEGDPNAVLVPALGRSMKDYVHLDTAGMAELGAEIARALLKVRYGRRSESWPGPVLASARAGGAKVVVASFAEAKALGGVEAADFGVRDAGGEVRCTRAQARGAELALELERPIRPPARLIYGFGQNPKASLVDEGSNRAPAAQVEISAGGRGR